MSKGLNLIMSKTKKITNVGAGASNPFGIKGGAGGFDLGKQMLRGKVGVKKAGDNRKAVRVPVELYNELVKSLSHGEAYTIMTDILNSFFKEFEVRGNEIVKKFEKIKTRPIKISEEAFSILKVIKFETDQSNTEIIASAIVWYLDKNKNKGKA